MRFLDFFGTLLSLLSTYCFVRADIKMWPIAIIAILVNTVLYCQVGMLATVCREVLYLVISLYGWLFWRNVEKSQNQVLRVGFVHAVFLIIMIYPLYYLMVAALSTLSSRDLMSWDAAAVSISLIAQWLTSRKVIECWLFWFVADSIYISIMLDKGLVFHAILYTLYLLMAVMGFFNWLKIYRKQAGIIA